MSKGQDSSRETMRQFVNDVIVLLTDYRTLTDVGSTWENEEDSILSRLSMSDPGPYCPFRHSKINKRGRRGNVILRFL